MFRRLDGTKIYNMERILLGSDVLESGHILQHVVQAGDWFGAYPSSGPLGYSLVGCTVVPGFEFEEFELAREGGERLLEELKGGVGGDEEHKILEYII